MWRHIYWAWFRLKSWFYRGKTKRSYLCGVAWGWEVGETDVRIFAHPDDVDNHGDECGIAEVEIRFVRWIEEPKLRGGVIQ